MALSKYVQMEDLINDERYTIPTPSAVIAAIRSMEVAATLTPSFKYTGKLESRDTPVLKSLSIEISPRVLMVAGSTGTGTNSPLARAFEVDDLISILPPILPYTLEYESKIPSGIYWSVTPPDSPGTVTLTTQTYFTGDNACALGMLKSTREIHTLRPFVKYKCRSVNNNDVASSTEGYLSLINLFDFASSTVVANAASCPTTSYDGYTAYLHCPVAVDLSGPRFFSIPYYYEDDVYLASTSFRYSGNASLMPSSGLPQTAMPNLIIMDDNTPLDRIKVAGEGLLDNFIEESKSKLDSLTSPYGGGGMSSTGGGGGKFNDGASSNSNNTVPEDSAENNYSNTGLFTIYAMSTAELQALGNKLYTTDWSERLEMEVMKLFWNSPIEAAISLQSFPFGLPGGTSATDIKFGSLVMEGISGSIVGKSAMSVDWGSIELSEYWGNFLDYAPHTKIDLYLPWGAGFVPIDPHECLPGNLSVKTNIELSKGTCVHIVSGKYGVIGCYGGKCSTEIPLTALDTGAKMLTTTVAVAAGGAAILAAGAGAIGAGLAAASAPLATGAAAAASPAVMQGAFGATVSTLSAGASSGYATVAPAVRSSRLPTAIAAALNPPHIQKSGSFYSSGAGLGPQKPFVIISRPEQNVPATYGHQYGYPSNITSGLSRGLGYTEVGAIHLRGIKATEYELAEIEKFLESGVVL